MMMGMCAVRRWQTEIEPNDCVQRPKVSNNF